MSSTLNRKLSSASIEGRRNSEDGLLSASGTLRRAAAIPVMEEDNALSPLKQLQRLNQNGSFRVVAKNRPSLPVPSHVRTNSCDKSSTSSSSPSSSSLSLESSGKRSDITDSCINNNVDKSSTTRSTENVCSPNHNDNRCLTTDDSAKHSTNKLSRSDTNGNITSPVSEKDSTDRTVSSCDSNLGPVTSYARESEDAGQTVDSQKYEFDGEGSSDKNEPRVNDKSPSYDRTEKSFCPLALDLHPHQSHIVDFTRTYGVPGPKQSPPPPPVTTQQVTVEVHRTDSPDSPSNSLRNGDMGVQPPASDCERNSSMKKEMSPATSLASESSMVKVLPKEQNAMSNNPVTSPDPRDEQRVISNKGLSPVSEGPVIVIHGESDYDVPRSQITRVNDPKSPTAVTPTRSKARLSRPKCKAPPPPTSPRTASIRDSLCSSSSTHSVNSSASSSQSESVTSQSSGISSSGSALSQCSQSTLTSDGEGSRPKVIDGPPRTPTHGYTRPKGPAPPPPANRKPARPPPIVFHERAVSEPKETLSVRSPHEGNYDIPKRIMSPHSPRPASVAPSWKCPVEGHYDVVRSPEAVSPLSRNVEVRRSTLGTTGEIKVTPIPRDNTQVSTFLAPATKPVIDVKLVKNDRKPTSPHPRNKVVSSTEEMNTINRQRMTRSAEDLDQKYADFIELPPPRPVSPTVRNSFMGSDVEIPREAVYNSIGEMNTILKTTVPEKEKIYSLPQPQCHGDDTLKAVKAITEKYDTLERHRQRAVSFRDNSRTSISSAAKSEPTSPMVAIQEVSASDPQLSDATDFVFPEGSQSGVPNNVDPPMSHRQVEDAPGSPDAIMDLSYGGIQARDISRIDLFYRGQGTEVVVCNCMASLSVGIPSATSDEIETWEGPLHTGVPVIVLNTGVGKRARELFVVLAERETGFPLWQDKVSYLTNYHPMSPLVHALSPAKNLRQKLAITFMQEQAAQEFLDKFKEITSNPNDDLWKISNPKQEKKHRRLSFRRKKNTKKDYNKTEISKPCNFTHLTNIDPKDRKLMQDISSHEYNCSGNSEQQQRRMKTKTM